MGRDTPWAPPREEVPTRTEAALSPPYPRLALLTNPIAPAETLTCGGAGSPTEGRRSLGCVQDLDTPSWANVLVSAVLRKNAFSMVGLNLKPKTWQRRGWL